MKTKKWLNFWTLSLALMAGIVFTGCSNMNNSRIDLSANEQQKEEAFNQILNNQELLNEFMNEMMANNNSMTLMMENGQFMTHMFNPENLDHMRQHNPEMDNQMMDHMMNMMERDTSLARNWNNRMQGRGGMMQKRNNQ